MSENFGPRQFPQWNILTGERATVALILTACGQDGKRGFVGG